MVQPPAHRRVPRRSPSPVRLLPNTMVRRRMATVIMMAPNTAGDRCVHVLVDRHHLVRRRAMRPVVVVCGHQDPLTAENGERRARRFAVLVERARVEGCLPVSLWRGATTEMVICWPGQEMPTQGDLMCQSGGSGCAKAVCCRATTLS